MWRAGSFSPRAAAGTGPTNCRCSFSLIPYATCARCPEVDIPENTRRAASRTGRSGEAASADSSRPVDAGRAGREDVEDCRRNQRRRQTHADTRRLSVAEVERRIYFYGLQMRDGQWRRADVLRALDGLSGDERLLALGEDSFAWAKVDRIPRGRESGRLRLFRIRCSNLPGVEDQGTVTASSFQTRQTGRAFARCSGRRRLFAAEFNFSAPRMSVFERLLPGLRTRRTCGPLEQPHACEAQGATKTAFAR